MLNKTDLINCNLPVLDKNGFVQDFILAVRFSMKGAQSTTLNLEDIQGTPRYFTGKDPLGNPTQLRISLSRASCTPDRKMLLFVSLGSKPDKEEKMVRL